MGDTTGIEWTDATWNPVRGCSRVSPGCENCYAERVAARFSGPGQPYEGLAVMGSNGPRWTREVALIADKLDQPLRWRKPRRIFVNSMSDLFHEGLDDGDIDQVLAVMLLAPRHTFQVLTKRARRMRDYLSSPTLYERVLTVAGRLRNKRPELTTVGVSNPATHPARWIWFGVSAEDQKHADERIPWLCETPAAVRFVSYEPALGPIDIAEYLDPCGAPCGASNEVIDWVIAGAESGPGARPMNEDWVRSVRDQCAAAGTAFFYKQRIETGLGTGAKKVALPVLDGRQHQEFPR
jgi:protein gp37